MRNFLYKGKPPPIPNPDKDLAKRYPQPMESIVLNLCRDYYHSDPITVMNLPYSVIQSHIIVLSEEYEFRKWEEAKQKNK